MNEEELLCQEMGGHGLDYYTKHIDTSELDLVLTSVTEESNFGFDRDQFSISLSMATGDLHLLDRAIVAYEEWSTRPASYSPEEEIAPTAGVSDRVLFFRNGPYHSVNLYHGPHHLKQALDGSAAMLSPGYLNPHWLNSNLLIKHNANPLGTIPTSTMDIGGNTPWVLRIENLIDARVNLLTKHDVHPFVIAESLRHLSTRESYRQARLSFILASAFSMVACINGSGIMHACENPIVFKTLDDGVTTHCADGPAIRWRDGTKLYALRDVVGDPMITEFVKGNEGDRERMMRTADASRNTETLRILIAEFGTERFLRTLGAIRIHEDQRGVLLQPAGLGDRAPFRMVCVKNSTTEADGSQKEYFLTVPPDIETAAAGVAWTMGFEGGGVKMYNPEAET